MTTKKSTKKNVVPPVEQPAPVVPVETATGQISSVENPEAESEEEIGKQEPLVLVVTKNEKLAELISACIVQQFSTPIAMIIPDYDPEKSLVEKITDLIATYEHEEVILFDSILPVNRFTMVDIISIYAERIQNSHDYNYNAKTPVLLERSKIVELLEEKPDISDTEFLNAYFLKFHANVLPVVTDWRNDTFTLPIISENPSRKILMDYQPRKRWFYISDTSANAVLKLFSEE